MNRSLLPLLLLLLLLFQPILFILNIPPIRRNRLITTRLLDRASKSRPSRIQLVPLLRGAIRSIRRRLPALDRRIADGHVASEALAHIDHAALTLAKALFQLLAFRGQGVDEGLAEAVGGFVALDHDAFGFLEALCQRIAWGASISLESRKVRRGWLTQLLT